MTNRLRGSMAYLAGPMDLVPDRGVEWRIEISEFLWKMGIGVLNPCDNPVTDSLKENDGYYELIKELKKQGRYDEVETLAKKIVRTDLHLIDLCNFCIVYIDTDVHSSGTNTELTYASLEKKPVILMCKQGKAEVPNFLWGIGLGHNKFFSNWNEVKEYLLLVAYQRPNAVPDFSDWRFIDYSKVFGPCLNQEESYATVRPGFGL